MFYSYLKLFIGYNKMAVPKKRTSKSKKKIRKAVWIKKSSNQAHYSFSLSKSLNKKNPTSFVNSVSLEQRKTQQSNLGFK